MSKSRERSSVESDRADFEVKRSRQIREEFDRAFSAAEKLENGKEILWDWLGAIALKLGIKVSRHLAAEK